MTQRPSLFWRGRGMGGSSAVNGLLAIRALPEDHDGWGIPGWGWADLLPCYRRIERDCDFGVEPWHGTEGPLPVRRLPERSWGAVDRALVAAATGAGYGWCPDHNAPTGEGVSPYAFNGDPVTDERVTAADAWLEPARGRPNLTVFGEVLVDRIEWVGTRAVGVRARIGGDWQSVGAGEVVLCAGAIHSPAILLRSGVGPSGSVATLPVGEHLVDHPLVMTVLPLRDDALPLSPFDRHTNVCVRYSSELAGAGRADMMIVGMNTAPAGPVGLLGAWVNECTSEGRVRLASHDPTVDPIVEEDMLTTDSDRLRLRDGLRRVLELAASPAFAGVLAAAPTDTLGRPLPAATDGTALDAWAQELTLDAQHPCGTARMGTGDDSVVDASCRVHAVEGVRVVDASVFPAVPRANTHLAVLATAERAAQRW